MAAGPDARDSKVDGSGPDESGVTTGRIAAGLAILVLLIAVALWMMMQRSSSAPITQHPDQVRVLTGGGSLPVAAPGPSAVQTPPAGVKVPDVTGKTQADAETRLQSVGLRSTTSQQSAGIPVGDVLTQSPAPGAVVAQGDVVALVISSGLTNATSGSGGPYVPSALGLTGSSGRNTLESAGYGVDINYAPSTSTQRGLVFYQDPGAGETAAHGTTVDMWVSTGPPTQYPYERPPIP